MATVLNGIQQIGIGVTNVNEVFNWYKRHCGFDILLFRDIADASLMTAYTNNNIEKRDALLTLNLEGGGGLEIWQFKDRIPLEAVVPILLGDLGINAMCIRANCCLKAHKYLGGVPDILVTEIVETEGQSSFFFIDPWNNWVQVIEDSYCFKKTSANVGGVLGAIIGVSNMEKSLAFYNNILGYTEVLTDDTRIYNSFGMLAGGNNVFRRVVLRQKNNVVGGFGELLGPTQLELIQVMDRKPKKIYEARLWGDLGYIHLCFDIQGMEELREKCGLNGHAFTVDSAKGFDMGDAAGHFSYVEDPDGTLIEFVETHKVPILKKWGFFINLKKRNRHKVLPRWLVYMLKFQRIKKDI